MPLRKAGSGSFSKPTLRHQIVLNYRPAFFLGQKSPFVTLPHAGLCKWSIFIFFLSVALPLLPPSLLPSLSLTCWNKHSNCITRFPGLTFGSRKRAQFEHVSVIRGGKVISYTQLDCVYKGPRRQVYLFCFIQQLNQTVECLAHRLHRTNICWLIDSSNNWSIQLNQLFAVR